MIWSHLALEVAAIESDPKKRTNQGLIIPLLTFSVVGLISLVAFCVNRRVMTDIYSPRRMLKQGRPPKIARGFLTWIPVVYRSSESFLIGTCGLDSVILLRFFKLGYRLFSILTILCLGILGPVNFYSNPPDLSGVKGYRLEDVILSALSVDNVPDRSPYFRIHLAFTWLVSILTIGFLVRFYRDFVNLKLQYEEYLLIRTNMSKIEMRSVMVFGIPRELRNELDLAAYFSNLGVGKVENVVLCRNWSKLQEAVIKRAEFLLKLETVYVQCQQKPRHFPTRRTNAQYNRGDYLFNRQDRHERIPFLQPRGIAHSDTIPDEIVLLLDSVDAACRPTHNTGFMGCFGERVDSALHYAAEFRKWDYLVAKYRSSPESSSPTAVGIITFESPESANLVSQVVVHRRPFANMLTMAPEPRDIYWANLSSPIASNHTKLARGLFVVISTFLLVSFSTVIVTTIAGLIDLEQLAILFPILGAILHDLPETQIQFVQGVIPVLLLAAWNSSLPSVLLILCQAQGIEASSWIENSLLSKYFFYQILNVLFVSVVAKTFFYDILQNPSRLIEVLGQMLPKSSPTIANYVILQGIAIYPMQLLLAGPLFLTWVTRVSSWTKITPRQSSDAYYPATLTGINYGIVYPVPLLVFVMGLTYAPIAPIILPFCTIFFAVGYFVYKYLILYVHIPKYESRGVAATFVVNRCLVGLFVMQLTMMGVLALRAGVETDISVRETTHQWSGYAQMVIGVAPLLFGTVFVYSLLNHGYKRQIKNVPLEVMASIKRETEAKATRAGEARPATNPLGANTAQESEQELSEMTGAENLRGGLHHRYSSLSVTSRQGANSYSAPVGPPPDSPAKPLLQNNQSLLDGYPSEDFPDPEEELETENTLPETDNMDDFNDALALSRHVEPPMSRVPGILDAPLGASIVEQGDHDSTVFSHDPTIDDLQLHTYLHPALIGTFFTFPGKLPVAWLPISNQRLEDLRNDQTRLQQQIWQRIVSKQQVGFYVLAQDEREAGDEDFQPRIRSFIDGVSSWVHLLLS